MSTRLLHVTGEKKNWRAASRKLACELADVFPVVACLRLRRRSTGKKMGTSHSRLWTITIPISLSLLAFAHYRWRLTRQRKIEHYEQVGQVIGLFIYPVKSCAGISLETADCLTEGLQFDRSVYCFFLFVCL